MAIGILKLGNLSPGRKAELSGYVKLLLLWVAASDGNIDNTELDFAGTQFPDADGEIHSTDLMAVIRDGDLKRFQRAIRAVSKESRELRIAFLDLAITMAMADREIAVTEHHILRFYADALYLGTDLLKNRFRAISGQDWFEPGDPGNPEWWKKTGFKLLDATTARQTKIEAVKSMMKE